MATSSESAKKQLEQLITSPNHQDDWAVEFIDYSFTLFDEEYFDAQYAASPLDFIFRRRTLLDVPNLSFSDALCFLADQNDDACDALVSIANLHPKLTSELLVRTFKNLLIGTPTDPQIDLNEASLLCRLIADNTEVSEQVIAILKATLEESSVENSAFIGKCVQAFQQYLVEESYANNSDQDHDYFPSDNKQGTKLINAISEIVARWAFIGHIIPEKAASALCLASEVPDIYQPVKERILNSTDAEFSDLFSSLIPVLEKDNCGALSDALVSLGVLKSLFDRTDSSTSSSLEELQLQVLPLLLKSCQSNLRIMCAQFVSAIEYCSPEQAHIRQKIFLDSLDNRENDATVNSIIADLTITQLSTRVYELNKRQDSTKNKNSPVGDTNSRIIRLLSFACEIPKITGPSPYDEPKSRKALRYLYESAFEKAKYFSFDSHSRSKKPNFGATGECLRELLANRNTPELLQDLRSTTLFSYLEVQTASGSTVHFIYPLPGDHVTVNSLTGAVLRETLLADTKRAIGIIPSFQMLAVLNEYQKEGHFVPVNLDEHFFLLSDFYDHRHPNGAFQSSLNANFGNAIITAPLAISKSLRNFHQSAEEYLGEDIDEPVLNVAVAFFNETGGLWPALTTLKFGSMSSRLVANDEALNFVESNNLGAASEFGYVAFANSKWIQDAQRTIISIDGDNVPKFLKTLLTSKAEQQNQSWMTSLVESGEVIFVASPTLMSKLKLSAV